MRINSILRESDPACENLASQVPFRLRRIYWLYNVPAGAVRGSHAHRICEEYIVLISGKIKIVLNDKNRQMETKILQMPGEGVYIRPLLWKDIYFLKDSCLLVMSSELFDKHDYIYAEEYEQLCKTL